MSKKGRRARQQKRRSSMAPSGQSMQQATSADVDASTSAPPPPVDVVESVPPEPAHASESVSSESLPLPAREDSSFPPVDLDSHFFDREPTSGYAGSSSDLDEGHERDPRMALKLGPEAAQRRAQFQKYVKIAVGAASVLCLAALVKAAVARNHDEPSVHRATASVVQPPPAAAPEQTAPRTEQPAAAEPQGAAPAAPETAAEPPAAAAPAAAPAPETSAAAPAQAAAPAPAAVESAAASAEPAPTAPEGAEAQTPDPKAAAKAKRASQTALERGKLADAIDQGEHSVALDPSDAEAWLILGAAYQAKGDQKNARRSFKSCLEQSKRGPKWECAQFPH